MRASIRLAALALILLAGPALSAEPGTVRVRLFDRDMPTDDKWPAVLPASAEEYTEPAFGFTLTPAKFVGSGVRADRGYPYLLQATAEVTLPEGKYRLLLRARGAARLTIDGEPVAELPFTKVQAEGLTPLRRDALALGHTRYVAPGDFEKLAAFTATGKPQTVVLEVMVGAVRNKDVLRPELGETLVAVAPAGTDDFALLGPGRLLSLTDAAWEKYAAEQVARVEKMEAERRRELFANQAGYWAKRRELAAAFVRDHPPPAVPAPSKTLPANNPIDHFLNAKLEPAIAVSKNPTAGVQFHRDIQPIFAAKCASCHGPNKPKSGFRIDDKTIAFAGGDSGEAGLVAGRLEKSEVLRRAKSADPDEVMPPKGEKLTAKELALLEAWVKAGAEWPDEAPVVVTGVTALTTDEEFLRRVFLDLVGTVPSVAESRAFLADRSPDKRTKLIDTLLADPRWADGWMPYWLDVLAENPNIVNPTLNNSGPFRWWLLDVLRDNKPWDAAVTELVQMEGSVLAGGPAGFGMAALNDSPAAAKAGILASAFLAVETKCARCHDAPYHQVAQADLFKLAGMISRKPVTVPATSSVPVDKFAGRQPLVNVTLKPGTKVEPGWSLVKLLHPDRMPPLPAWREADPRTKLAALITSPENERFAEVFVNRVWRRYMGRGIVEPPQDWENAKPSHPELLKWLAREFVANGYDLKHLTRLVLNSHAYQRQATTDRDAVRLFAAPAKRRLGPEVLADSLWEGFGRTYDTEILCFDLDAGRPWKQGVNFGIPRRAWQIPYLGNDRDRPTLALPKAQAVADLMTAFGWDGNRQFPVNDRVAEPNVLQPALLANGTAAKWLTRLSDDTALTQLCVDAKSPEELVETLFLRVLTRLPTAEERRTFVAHLAPGFADRVTAGPPTPKPKPTQPYASWAGHHTDDAVILKQAETEAARRGPPPTGRLNPQWRERAEDVLWALLNSPEIVYVP